MKVDDALAMGGCHIGGLPFPIDFNLSDFGNVINQPLVPQVPRINFSGRAQGHEGDHLCAIDFVVEGYSLAMLGERCSPTHRRQHRTKVGSRPSSDRMGRYSTVLFSFYRHGLSWVTC